MDGRTATATTRITWAIPLRARSPATSGYITTRDTGMYSLAENVDHFIAKHAAAEGRKIRGLSPDARKLFMEYAWPGNVRQLESAIERAILLAETDRLEVEDL